MNILLAPLIVVIQTILAELVFVVRKMPKKKFFLLRFLISLSISIGYCFVWLKVSLGWFDLFNYFILFMTTIFMLYFCFEIKMLDVIFWGIAGLTVQHIIYSLTTIVGYLNAEFTYNVSFTVVITIVILFFEYAVIVRKVDYENLKKENYKELMAIAGFVVFSTEILNSLRSIYSDSSSHALNLICSIYSVMCCVLSLIIQFGLLNRLRLTNELQIIKQMWHNDKKQFNASEQNIEMLNLYCHDMKHILNKMDVDGVDEEYKNRVKDVIAKYEANIHTNNHALDVILTEKSLYCQSHGINFTCIADGEKLNQVKTTDLYSIFGNILNNAIEAVSKLEDDKHKNISLIVNQKNNFIYIHCENEFDGKIDFAGELPKTLKSDAKYHGYGLKSVKLYVERYNGNITVNTKDNIFYINILIPIV